LYSVQISPPLSIFLSKGRAIYRGKNVGGTSADCFENKEKRLYCRKPSSIALDPGENGVSNGLDKKKDYKIFSVGFSNGF
jgi:hypothetical protein